MVFADLEGSTAMEEHLDPEIVRSILSRFYRLSREILERHGGTVEKFIGDAVVGVFGVPRSHEDDALRAARAGVELRDTIARTNQDLLDRYGVALRLRIGVNTGEVLAGDPTETSFVSGDAVNVAARLEQNAPAGGILIGEDTYLAVRGFVRAAATDEPMTLKGKSRPVEAFHLLDVVEYREQRPIDSPIVGRDREMLQLRRSLRRVTRSSVPALVLVAGEPGIGKTRLVDEFLRSIGVTANVALTSCPADADTPWRPVVRDLVRQLLGPGEMDGDHVRERVATLLGPAARAPLVADELARSIDADEPGPLNSASWALRELIAALSVSRTVIVGIDDVDRGGAELVGLLRDLLRRVAGPVMFLATAVPEFALERDGPVEHAERLNLGRLERSTTMLLAERLLGGPPTESIERTVIDASDGNPLFLTEMMRMLRDRRALHVDEGGRVGVVDEWSVPHTIRSLIGARLDLLSDGDRDVLCLAAVLGSVVDVDDLRALVPHDSSGDLDVQLRRLVERQLLVEDAAGRFRFPHMLVRTVAYETLTKEERADLHVACAELRESHEDAAGAGAHYERAYKLRVDLRAHGDEAGSLARRAAAALAVAGIASIERQDRGGAIEYERRAMRLCRGVASAAPADVSDLAFRLGVWEDVVGLLDRGRDEEVALADAHRLGVAIVKRDGVASRPDDLARGRRLLETAGSRGDVAALGALAGTWRGVDDDRATALYRAVVDIDRSEPYALGNLLEVEIARTRDLSVVAERRAAIAEAIERRRAQALAGRDVPWSWFDLGKFELLLGATEDAFRSFSAGVLTSTAAYMATSALASVERIARSAPELTDADDICALLRLSKVAAFDAERDSIADLATPGAPGLIAPIVVVAGASGATSVAAISRVRPPLLGAVAGVGATVISGGTTSGVSGLVGDLSAAVPTIRSVGYLPMAPVGPERDERYTELRQTPGESFGPGEPLRYWADILTGGNEASDVCVLAVGGGPLSAIEFRIALAFGARVGVVEGTGGEAGALMADPVWGLSDRVLEVHPTEIELRNFLLQDGVAAPEAARAT